MPTPFTDATSLLVVDIGSSNTRVMLFDEAGGQYHFIASGSAPSTVVHPFHNLNDGLLAALAALQETTGRSIVDEDSRLILPSLADGSGVDSLAITFSAGPEIRILTLGLLKEISLESVNRLASSINGRVVESIGMNDRRSHVEALDAILESQPDLIIMAGGTDQGATRPIQKLVELVLQACRLMPKNKIPIMIYAGNQALAKTVKERLESTIHVFPAPNIHPSIDQENLPPAQEILAQVVAEIRSKQFEGLPNLRKICSIPPIPSSHAFSRVIRYLSMRYDSPKGVLGIDLGGGSIAAVTAIGGQEVLTVLPLGVGSGLKAFMEQADEESISRWISKEITPDVVRDYLWQKSLYPASIPATAESLSIEQAAAREIIHAVMQVHRAQLKDDSASYELILASGATLSQTPSPGEALMMLLDGIQPVGITSIILDRHGLTSGLGAAAPINSLLPVQVVDSSAYVNLATVITPLSSARQGTPIVRVSMEYGQSSMAQLDIKQGSLVAFPLPPGQTASIHLEPAHGTIIDPYRKASGFKIWGGLCGVVIDARGRPLTLPEDPALRKETIKHWSSVVGA